MSLQTCIRPWAHTPRHTAVFEVEIRVADGSGCGHSQINFVRKQNKCSQAWAESVQERNTANKLQAAASTARHSFLKFCLQSPVTWIRPNLIFLFKIFHCVNFCSSQRLQLGHGASISLCSTVQQSGSSKSGDSNRSGISTEKTQTLITMREPLQTL